MTRTAIHVAQNEELAAENRNPKNTINEVGGAVTARAQQKIADKKVKTNVPARRAIFLVASEIGMLVSFIGLPGVARRNPGDLAAGQKLGRLGKLLAAVDRSVQNRPPGRGKQKAEANVSLVVLSAQSCGNGCAMSRRMRLASVMSRSTRQGDGKFMPMGGRQWFS
jgi:hypothetical protein